MQKSLKCGWAFANCDLSRLDSLLYGTNKTEVKTEPGVNCEPGTSSGPLRARKGSKRTNVIDLK
jgi:hypothetical protein